MNVFYTLKNGLNGKFYVTCTLPFNLIEDYVAKTAY